MLEDLSLYVKVLAILGYSGAMLIAILRAILSYGILDEWIDKHF